MARKIAKRKGWQEILTCFATNALPGNACSLRHQALVLWDQRRPSPCRILFPRFDQRVRLQWRAPSPSTPSTCLRKSPPTGRCSDESTAAKRKFLRTTTLLSPENADRISLYHGFRWLSSLKWQSNAYNRRYYIKYKWDGFVPFETKTFTLSAFLSIHLTAKRLASFRSSAKTTSENAPVPNTSFNSYLK